jgi:amino acid adenylation domain-containing protein
MFRIGNFLNGEFETTQVVIDGTSTLSQVKDAFDSAEFSTNAEALADCVVAIHHGQNHFRHFGNGIEQLELVFQIDEESKQITIHIRRDKHDHRNIRNWLSIYQSLGSRFAEKRQLDQFVSEIDLTTEQVRKTVLQFGNRHNLDSTFNEFPSKEYTFHKQFEKQVDLSPHRIAVWAKEEAGNPKEIQWDYKTLNRQSNAIAKFLIDAGIEVEDTVGIVMARRVCLLAALLGVMKAGGRYVALEPELPDDRLAFMTDDASVKFMITETAHLVCATDIANAARQKVHSILNWDDSSFQNRLRDGISSGYLDQNPDVDVHSRNGAYLIYTSGSTGLPKGVDVWHHSFVDLCKTFIATLDLDEDATSLGIATIAFDASICELFPPLLIGGKVAIGRKRAGASGTDLSKLIDEAKATYMFATPTSLRLLAASGWRESSNLTVIAGGEAVSSLVCREIGPRVKRLLNGYGPTETTVFATLGPLSENQSDPVPIGPPILNSRAYVLDEVGQLLPPMVPGELFIGGQSPARGYLNRPELTAKKFRPDPFLDSSGVVAPTMYATGDVVYWGFDGFLYYVGRNDHQVKLRGYRIELGEIEARLCAHPAIKDAVAMVREDEPGQQQLVAYVVYETSVADTVLQDYLLCDMPEYMVPTWFVPLDSIPVNANLKLDRKALPAPSGRGIDEPERWSASVDETVASGELANRFASVWSSILKRKIRCDDHVFRMGADSLTAVKFQTLLLESYQLEIPIGEIFQYPTPNLLAQQLHPRNSSNQEQRKRTKTGVISDIAVVGFAGRFPGASNVDIFWQNLVNGVESIRDFTEQELVEAGVSAADYLSENYVARGTVLDDAYHFEPEFFGVTRSDAEVVSPQIRLFMKTAWEALEIAGYPEEPAGTRIGVFAGCGNPNYLAAERHVPEAERLQRLIGNGADFLATRTAYALGLTGPAISVQTACSTSLVAVANAVNAIRNGQCEMAIAGGSSCSWPMGEGYQQGAGLIYSADGHCRTFDHRASGTIFSQASGAVLLRPLQDAIKAGDTIHAVIKGIAVNNDGDRKGGYAAPSIQGQCDVIQAALDDAEVSADQIELMEAHGTATKIGDPIEISGLKRAWQRDTQEKQFCAIGSVKANVGHADAAAGIVGLLKVILSLQHKTIPPLVNYESPNPEIVFEDTPFYVNTKAMPWQSEKPTRLAAISSFGMGGTNAHLIVAEGQSVAAVEGDNGDETLPLQLIPFSARTRESLDELVESWSRMQLTQEHALADIAFTLQAGRKHFGHRAVSIVKTPVQLKNSIAAVNPAEAVSEDSPALVFGRDRAVNRKVVFLFTGQGAQYSNMARDLYENEPVFRAAIDHCDAQLNDVADGLIQWLFSESPACDINQTRYAQVALFAVSYAQAKLWQSWGVSPAVMIGHSIGEYVAATIAGVFSLNDALAMVAKRGQLMQSMPAGSMLAVMHHEHDIQALLEQSDHLDLAVINSRSVAVVAGPNEAIDRFAQQLETQGIKSRQLKTSHAFHSRMMEPMLDSFIQAFSEVELSSPKIPYLSNVSGTWITKEQSIDPNYYADQIRSTVKFAENLESLMKSEEDYLFIELGPGTTLTQISKSQFAGGNHAAVATLPGPKQADCDSHQFVWEALGRCWIEGLDIQWEKLRPATQSSRRPRRVTLPTYCFNEQIYRAKKERIGHQLAKETHDSWYNVPVWKQEFLTGHAKCSSANIAPQNASRWLVLTNGKALSRDEVSKVLASEGHSPEVIAVKIGKRYAKFDDYHYSIRPGSFEDYQQLLLDIEAGSKLAGVIHGWTLDNPRGDFWKQQETSTVSLAWLSKAIGEVVVEHAVLLNILTRGVADLDPTVAPEPASHCFLGGAAVVQKEYRSINTKVIDVGNIMSDVLTNQMLGRLLTSQRHEPLVAFDRGKWWKRDFDRVTLPADTNSHIRDGAVITITGGLGGLARKMALQLSEQYQDLKIILLARNVLPPEEQWEQILSSSREQDCGAKSEIQQRIADYQLLQSRCDVHIWQCDVSNEQQYLAALKQIGKIDLLLHTAGVLNDGIVAAKTWDQLEPVLAAKSFAADVCYRYIMKSSNAICAVVFFSSIASDIGLFGQFAYSAANNYLDGICQRVQHAGCSTKVFSINWPAFRDVGMAARSQVDLSTDAALQREIAENSFTVTEGTQALIEIVNNPLLPRVALSKQLFSQRLQVALEDSRSVDFSSYEADNMFSKVTDMSVENRMMKIWRQQFGNEGLTLDDDYFDQGGDSLMAVGMIAMIESTFNKMVPISHLINSPTPRKLIRKLELDDVATKENRETRPEDTALPAIAVRLKRSESQQPPLFLLHGADGAVMFYRDFANRLNTQSSIYGLESPFLNVPNFQIPDSVEELAEEYVKAILAIEPQGPYRIAGYSFGGVLAYEIARQIEKMGNQIEMVILYDVGNPALLQYNSWAKRLMIFWAQEKNNSLPTKLTNLAKRISRSVKDRASFEFENRLAKTISVDRLDNTFWRHKKAREQHMAIEERYAPEPVGFPARIVFATGNSSKLRVEEDMGWAGVASDLQVQRIEGSHLEIFDKEYVGEIVQATETFLLELEKKQSRSDDMQ